MTRPKCLTQETQVPSTTLTTPSPQSSPKVVCTILKLQVEEENQSLSSSLISRDNLLVSNLMATLALGVSWWQDWWQIPLHSALDRVPCFQWSKALLLVSWPFGTKLILPLGTGCSNEWLKNSIKGGSGTKWFRGWQTYEGIPGRNLLGFAGNTISVVPTQLCQHNSSSDNRWVNESGYVLSPFNYKMRWWDRGGQALN
jgi:hypothetical protein